MGVIRRGILGGFSKKVGNIVGSSWKGLAVIKSLPLSVANPRTAGQVIQRNKFRGITLLGSSLLASIVKPLWDRFASNMSGFNAFVSANLDAFNNNGLFVPAALVTSKGRMLAPQSLTCSGTGNTRSIIVGHPANDRFALPTDRLAVVIIDSANARVRSSSVTTTTRSTNTSCQVTATLDSAAAFDGTAQYYVSYVRADGTEVSNSKHGT